MNTYDTCVNMVLFMVSSIFMMTLWSDEKQCEVLNNNLQCGGYQMHTFKLLLKNT